jgi:hypothetical protein
MCSGRVAAGPAEPLAAGPLALAEGVAGAAGDAGVAGAAAVEALARAAGWVAAGQPVRASGASAVSTSRQRLMVVRQPAEAWFR